MRITKTKKLSTRKVGKKGFVVDYLQFVVDKYENFFMSRLKYNN